MQNDVEILKISPVVLELQSTPYCKFWRNYANYQHIFIENNRLATKSERYNQVYYTLNKGLGNIYLYQLEFCGFIKSKMINFSEFALVTLNTCERKPLTDVQTNCHCNQKILTVTA